MKLQVIPVEKIIPDPDVQYDWTFNQRVAQRIAAAWDEAKAGVIDVIPLNGPNSGFYGVFVGRHRHWGAKAAGVKALRCDVWPQGLTVAEKFAIKLAKDRDKRTVKRIETFLNEVGAREPKAMEIFEIAEKAGYEIGKTSGGGPYTRIEAVNALESLHRKPGRLASALAFNTTWYDQPQTNHGRWLIAMGACVDQGWIDLVSPSGWEALRNSIPNRVLREAVGRARTFSTSADSPNEISTLIADKLRRTARVRKPSGRMS